MPATGPAAPDAPSGWAGYFAATAARPPRRTALAAIAALDRAGGPGPAPAIDLGCGGGRDTAALLDAGLAVLALDRAPEAATALRTRFPDAWASGRLTWRQADFATGEEALPAACLVNASFCLPACPPARFPHLWSRIVRAIRPQGLFAGHLYGPNDSWARRGDDLAIHSRRDIEALLGGWETLLLEEEETDARTPRGRAKHWHIFHIVARKPR